MVDPVNRALRWNVGPNRVTSQRIFHTPGLASARTIVGLTQKRTPLRPFRRTENDQGSSFPSMGRAQGSNRPNQGASNGPPDSREPISGSANGRGEEFCSARFEWKVHQLIPPRVSGMPAVSQSRVSSVPAPSDRSSFGGFTRGGFFSGMAVPSEVVREAPLSRNHHSTNRTLSMGMFINTFHVPQVRSSSPH